MKPTRKISQIALLALAVLGVLFSAHAEDKSITADNTFGQLRAAPQGFLPPLKPVMDVPMRDPHAMLGPDGFYYLTATTPPEDDPKKDFWAPYNGIRVYRSPDLKTWENLGYVFTLKDNATWQTTFNPEKLLPDFVKDREHPKPTIWAPDIYYIKGTWWIAYSVAYNGWGCVTGLLKSTSGQPTGPYVDVRSDLMSTAIDAGLFQDDDGKVYFVWCDGKFALMNDRMDALAEPTRTAHPSNNGDIVAFEGCALRKINGRYYMLASGDGGNPSNYHGLGTYDCWVASTDTIYGDYGPNYLAIRNGGHNVFFPGKGGAWWSTFFGWNPTNPFNERPGFLRIQLDEYARVQPYYNTFTVVSPDARTQGATWQYTLKAPAADWANPRFDDRTWDAALGGFGLNAVMAMPVPVRTLWPTADIWLRREFTLPAGKIDDLQLALDIFHSGSAEVFINGVPAYASKEGLKYYRQSLELSPEALKALIPGGTNVIAIHSTSGDSRFIDAGLRLFTHREPVPVSSGRPVVASAGATPSLQVDLGKDFEITRTDVAFDTPKQWYQYKIEYSADKTTWQTFYDSTSRKVVGDPYYSDVFDNGISADHVTGRYVRVTATAAQSGAPVLKELRVFGHLPVAHGDLARGKPVQASRTDERFPAKNVVDGYWGTRWRAAGDLPQWLSVDLGSVQTIHACKTWFGTEGLIYGYRLETSKDGQTWTLFADRSTNDLPCDPHYTDYAEASARYVRLTALSRNNGGPVDVRDFQIFGASTPIPPAILEPGKSLLGHWKLDETGGQTVADASPAHNDGTLTGAATWLPKGAWNGALELHGGKVAVARGAGETFTLTFWLKTTESGRLDSWKSGKPLITASGGEWGVSLVGTTVALGWGNRTLYGTAAVNDGEWHRCTVTRWANGQAQLAVDGNPQVTVEQLGPAATKGGLVFGGESFNGALDDIRLFNRPLSETELALITTPLPSLAGKWNFTANSRDNVVDASGNGHDLKLFKDAKGSDDGVGGGSLILGDGDAYGEVERVVKDDFTIGFWIKTTQESPERSWNNGAWLLNGEMPGSTNDFGSALADGRFVFGTGAPDISIRSKTKINDGKWHHCVATRRRATGAISVYVDGKIENTATGSRSSLTAPSVLRLGGTGSQQFVGALSELVIYDGVLSEAEIKTWYQKRTADHP